MDVLVRTTISANFTTPTCRSLYELEFRENHFLTSLRRKVFDRFIPTKPQHSCANEINRRVFCTLSEFIQSAIYASRMLSDFYTDGELPTIIPGWVFLLLHSLLTFSSKTPCGLRCKSVGPICVRGASEGSRTPVCCLEGSHNSRYTTPAYNNFKVS